MALQPTVWWGKALQPVSFNSERKNRGLNQLISTSVAIEIERNKSILFTKPMKGADEQCKSNRANLIHHGFSRKGNTLLQQFSTPGVDQKCLL